MNMYTYGTKGYYEDELKRATLRYQLIREAISSRLTNNKLNAEELMAHAEILQEVQDRARRCQEDLDKYLEEHPDDDSTDA